MLFNRRVRQVLDEHNLEAILLINEGYPPNPNFAYFLRPKTGLFEGCFIILERESNEDVNLVLFTSLLEKSAAEKFLKKEQIRVIERGKRLEDYLREHFISKQGCKVGFDGKHTSYNMYVRLRSVFDRLDIGLVDVSKDLCTLREIKSEEEIEIIKKAVQISEDVLRKVVSEGDISEISESEIAARLMYYIWKNKCEYAFEPIVAFDENAAIPHYRTGLNDKPKAERVILIDFGVKYEHYCSDITRTFIVKKDEEVMKAYETVLEAQLKAINAIRAGVKAGEVDKVARDHIKEKLGVDFPHSLGHMFGVQVHEGRRLYYSERYELAEGMVFTVEPAVYFEGKFGIRIEDDVVVRKDCAEVLSKYPKELEDMLI